MRAARSTAEILLKVVVLAMLSLLIIACPQPLDPSGDPGTEDPTDDPVDDPVEIPLPEVGIAYVEPGTDYLLYWGDVWTPDGLLEAGQILIDPDGIIRYVGADASGTPGAADATRIVAAYGLAIPGLIDSRHHLSFSQLAPAQIGTGPSGDYDHRHEWRKGLNGKPELAFSSGGPGAIEWGEIRMAIHGVTSVVGFGSSAGMVRNLDDATEMADLVGSARTVTATFPLGDSDGLLTLDPNDYANPTNWTPADGSLVAIVAEGTIAEAHTEIEAIMLDAPDPALLSNRSIIGPLLAVTAQDVALISGEDTTFLWTPRSDLNLYGYTAPVTLIRALGGDIALGSTWTFTGSGSVLRELAAAAEFNETYLDSTFSDLDLFEMVTTNPAQALGLDHHIGSIEVGKVADIVVVSTNAIPGLDAVISATPARIGLVLRSGRPLYGDDTIIDNIADAAGFEPISIPGSDTGIQKWVAIPGEFGTTAAALESTLGSPYPLVFNDYRADGDEPPAAPRRSTIPAAPSAADSDGDGIANGEDNAPNHYNPIRPMEAVQPDSDADGIGDVADPTPLGTPTVPAAPGSVSASDSTFQYKVTVTWSSSTGAGVYFVSRSEEITGPFSLVGQTTTTSFDDVDVVPGDGFYYAVQAAAFPGSTRSAYSAADAGSTAGSLTVAQIRQGAVTGRVLTEPTIVTAVGDRQFFVHDTGGGSNSGIYVWTGTTPTVSPGDLVVIDAEVGDFFGNLQLEAGASPLVVTVLASGQTVTPTVLSAAPAGGWEEYEGEFVSLSDVVAAIPDPGGVATTNYTDLELGVLLYDYASIYPAVSLFDHVHGVIYYEEMNYRLMPREASDLVQPAGPWLVAMSPSSTYLLDGSTAVPLPDLSVQISEPAGVGVEVSLTYSDPGIVTGPATMAIAEGTDSASVVLTGVMPGTADVTAALGGVGISSSVRVYDDAEPREPSLSPASTTVETAESVGLSVVLSLPAPAGGQTVGLSAAPGTSLSIPTSVQVIAGELSASFNVTGLSAGVETVTATIGPASDSSTVTVIEPPSFATVRIVEVYYDHTLDDDGYEWVVLYNATGSPVDLTGYSLGWGGVDYSVGGIDLVGTIADGDTFVVGGPEGDAVNGFASGPAYDQTANLDSDLQNSGSTADGVALFDMSHAVVTGSSVPLDAVIYGDTNSNGLLDETGSVGLVDAPDAPAESSIQMQGNGTWAINGTPSPQGPFPPIP